MTPTPLDHIDATATPPFPNPAGGLGRTLPDSASEDFVGYESTHPLTWLPVWQPQETQPT